MQNSSQKTDVSRNPKLRLIKQLIRKCYSENVTHSYVLTDKFNEEEPWCPRTFDGFACWDETPSGTTATQRCPEFVVGFDPRRFAYKRCTDNGTWYLHPDVNKPWTNYTTCIDVEDLDFRNVVNNIYVIGYCVSVAALLISLVIFMYFRTLQCTRIRIHMHLFTSFALNNILWIVWYKTVVNTVTVVQDNEQWCQALHIVTHYFMVTSYFWMFCEGLHLHIALVVIRKNNYTPSPQTLCILTSPQIGCLEEIALCDKTADCITELASSGGLLQDLECGVLADAFSLALLSIFLSMYVFVKDAVAMRWFIAVGWVLSLMITVIYAAVRYHTGATERCWMDQSDTFWIIITPVVISLLASFVFLINVVRVLLTKLHPAPNQHASLAAKKATRAALILIPLFGLHFVLIPLRPSPDSPGENFYQVVSALLTSLQGLCVSVLFCFTNHDVMTAAKTHFSRFIRTNETVPMTGVTGAESMMNTKDNVA